MRCALPWLVHLFSQGESLAAKYGTDVALACIRCGGVQSCIGSMAGCGGLGWLCVVQVVETEGQLLDSVEYQLT